MIHAALWLSPRLAPSLGWMLLHFVWQGLALAAACSALTALCRTAAARYATAVATLALMLAAPAATFVVLWRAAGPDAGAASAAAASADRVLPAPAEAPGAGSTLPAAPLRPDLLLWLVEAWVAGVMLFSLRAAGGWAVAERMRRARIRPVGARVLATCLALQRRMGLGRAIRYCECLGVRAPAVYGWLRPVVLLPMAALSGLSEDQLVAVIAHELAHVRRLDWCVNLVQIGAETLLFYQPAVWWLSRRIRAERENCCDDAALAACGNAVEYARALALMEEWRQLPAMAMAANRSPLMARVSRMLGAASPRGGVSSVRLAVSVACLAGAIFAGNGLLGVQYSAVPASAARTGSVPAPPLPAAGAMLPAPAVSVAQAGGAQTAAAPAPPTHAAASAASSYIDQMRAAGLGIVTTDELIGLKVQDVTPAYIRAMRAAGINGTARQFIGLRVQGVTPEYVRAMKAAGLTLDARLLIGMRVQGVTPEYVQAMKAAGLTLDARLLIGMRVQGVTPEYVQAMKAAGVGANARELIGMRVQGVTVGYVKALQGDGLQGLKARDYIRAKVAGVTPEFIASARSHGFRDLTLDKLIALARAGVL